MSETNHTRGYPNGIIDMRKHIDELQTTVERQRNERKAMTNAERIQVEIKFFESSVEMLNAVGFGHLPEQITLAALRVCLALDVSQAHTDTASLELIKNQHELEVWDEEGKRLDHLLTVAKAELMKVLS
jgi:uncharacterized OsmC-like protein